MSGRGSKVGSWASLIATFFSLPVQIAKVTITRGAPALGSDGKNTGIVCLSKSIELIGNDKMTVVKVLNPVCTSSKSESGSEIVS